MGVYRTDYLFWGVKLDPRALGESVYDRFEKECDGAPGRRFDMVYDGMSGRYAVAGRHIAKSDPDEGLGFIEVGDEALGFDQDAVASSVREAIGEENCGSGFRLYLFSHYA